MHNKPKIYLILSVFGVLLLLVAMIKSFFSIHLWGFSFDIIWIPTIVLVFWLPFLNIIEIIKNTEDYNILHWIALLLNLFCVLLILRYLGVKLTE
jgi:hypothetical protein